MHVAYDININCTLLNNSLQAREVLKWKAQKPEEANVIWSALAQVTEDIHTNFDALSTLAKVRNV